MFTKIFQEDGKLVAIEKLFFLVSKLFWGGMEVQKGHFRFGPSFTKCNVAAKRIYLSQKRNLSNLDQIISLPNANTAEKFVNGRPRCIGAFSWFLLAAL